MTVANVTQPKAVLSTVNVFAVYLIVVLTHQKKNLLFGWIHRGRGSTFAVGAFALSVSGNEYIAPTLM